METGVVKIQGKDYSTVALRVKEFAQDGWGTLVTEILESGQVILARAEIRVDGETRYAAHAEEKRVSEEAWKAMSDKEKKKNQVNYTNPLENAETSAVGRVLALAGYLGGDIATKEDIQRAHEKARIEQYGEPDPELIRTLEEAAAMGMPALETAWKTISKEDRQSVGPHRLEALKTLAAKSDE